VRVHRCGAHAARYRIPTGWRRSLPRRPAPAQLTAVRHPR
jgi:hypothetical protein